MEEASQSEQIEFITNLSKNTFISHSLLQNIGVDCDGIVAQRVMAMTQVKVANPLKSKPIINSIIDDINIEKMKKDKQDQSLKLTQK